MAQGQTLQGVKAGAAQRLRGIPALGAPGGEGGPGGLCVMEQLTASAKRFGVQLFCPGFLSDGTVRLLLGAQLHLHSGAQPCSAIVVPHTSTRESSQRFLQLLCRSTAFCTTFAEARSYKLCAKASASDHKPLGETKTKTQNLKPTSKPKLRHEPVCSLSTRRAGGPLGQAARRDCGPAGRAAGAPAGPGGAARRGGPHVGRPPPAAELARARERRWCGPCLLQRWHMLKYVHSAHGISLILQAKRMCMSQAVRECQQRPKCISCRTAVTMNLASCIAALSIVCCVHAQAQRRHLARLKCRHASTRLLCVAPWAAGARLMNLVFQKYVLGLGWRVTCLAGAGVAAQAAPPGAGGAAFEPALAFLDSQVAQLEVRSGHIRVIRVSSCTEQGPLLCVAAMLGSVFVAAALTLACGEASARPKWWPVILPCHTPALLLLTQPKRHS